METSAAKNKNGGCPVIHCICRFLAAMAMLASAVLMGLNQQTTDFGGYAMQANYETSQAFKWLVYGNAAASAYSLLSLPLACFRGAAHPLHLLDMLVMALVMGSATGAAAIGYVGKYGNLNTGWMKVCNYYEKFCHKSVYSIGCSYLGFLLLFVAAAVSSRRK